MSVRNYADQRKVTPIDSVQANAMEENGRTAEITFFSNEKLSKFVSMKVRPN